MKIPVKQAFLHGSMGPKLIETTLTQEKLPGIEMFWEVDTYSLLVEYKGTRFRTPLSNVKGAVDAEFIKGASTTDIADDEFSIRLLT